MPPASCNLNLFTSSNRDAHNFSNIKMVDEEKDNNFNRVKPKARIDKCLTITT